MSFVTRDSSFISLRKNAMEHIEKNSAVLYQLKKADLKVELESECYKRK